MSDPIPGGLTRVQQMPRQSDVKTQDPVESKRQQVLNALEDSFPFFSANDTKTKTRTGDSNNPPQVGARGRSAGEAIKSFFTAIGKAIATPFKAIGAAIDRAQTRAAERRDLATQTQVHQTRIDSQTSKDGSITVHDATEFLSRALTVKNMDMAKSVLNGVTQFLQGQDHGEVRLDKLPGNTVAEKVMNALGDRAGSLGFSMTPKNVERLAEMAPELRIHFADNPVALAIINAFETNYDFNALMQQSFEHDISGLASIDTKATVEERDQQKHTVLDSAFRSNSFFTSGMKALVTEHFDTKAYGKSLFDILDTEMKRNPQFATATANDLKLDSMSDSVGESMMRSCEGLLDHMVNLDNIRDALGEGHLDRIQERAQQIADLPGVSSDIKNNMIDKLFIDQVFLRNLNATLMQHAQDNGVRTPTLMATSQIVQVLLNNANPVREPNESVSGDFNRLRQETKQAMNEIKTALGIPHVAPQDTDWTPPLGNL